MKVSILLHPRKSFPYAQKMSHTVGQHGTFAAEDKIILPLDNGHRHMHRPYTHSH